MQISSLSPYYNYLLLSKTVVDKMPVYISDITVVIATLCFVERHFVSPLFVALVQCKQTSCIFWVFKKGLVEKGGNHKSHQGKNNQCIYQFKLYNKFDKFVLMSSFIQFILFINHDNTDFLVCSSLIVSQNYEKYCYFKIFMASEYNVVKVYWRKTISHQRMVSSFYQHLKIYTLCIIFLHSVYTFPLIFALENL